MVRGAASDDGEGGGRRRRLLEDAPAARPLRGGGGRREGGGCERRRTRIRCGTKTFLISQERWTTLDQPEGGGARVSAFKLATRGRGECRGDSSEARDGRQPSAPTERTSSRDHECRSVTSASEKTPRCSHGARAVHAVEPSAQATCIRNARLPRQADTRSACGEHVLAPSIAPYAVGRAADDLCVKGFC